MVNIGLKIKELMSQKNIDAPELAKALGKTKQAIYAMIEKEDINTSVLRNICQYLDVPISVFLKDNVGETNEKAGEGYPIVDSFTGSMGAPIGDGQVSQSFVGDRMSVPGINQPGTIYLRVYGDSMLCPERPEDSIPSGAFVSLRPSSLSTFRWGELYALVTTDGVLIKKVMPADDPDHITCVSLNAEKYPPFQLCQEEVAEAWRVTGIVTVSLK